MLLFSEFKGQPGTTLHLWSSDDAWTTFTAHRNPDDTYSGTFSLKTGGFDELKSVADYEQLLSTRFAGIPEAWVPEVAQRTFKQTPNPAGDGTTCSAAWAASGSDASTDMRQRKLLH